jgi:KilA-N domain/C2H2-type zinc finger
MTHECNICNKQYASYQSWWNHNKKFHNAPPQNPTCLKCKYCSKELSRIDSKKRHEQKCKKAEEIKEKENKNIELEIAKENNIRLKEEADILRLKLNLQNDNNIKVVNKKLVDVVIENTKIIEDTVNNATPVNTQLINVIMEKNKKIEELSAQKTTNDILPTQPNNSIENKKVPTTLTLNNIVIVSRNEDNFINATQLCQAGGKQFAHWYSLESTKHLIETLKADIGIPISAKSETGILVSQLVDIKKGGNNKFEQGTWIHPDLAIQLAQWISPTFALQVSKWIRTLFATGHVEINKLLQEKEQRIKLLENTYLKKHQRTDYPEQNVIYMLTTEDHKQRRTYIIGKAKKLKNRLSSYNKTAEHEVVYYKSCKNEEIMNLVETMVLIKLKEYKEQANRDRFILPLEKDISFFKDIIENCCNFW